MSSKDSELNKDKQPLLEHLIELRSRIIKTMIMIIVFFIFFYIFADNIYNFFS